MKSLAEFQALLRQRTWDKEVLLWLGSEKSIVGALGSTNHIILDLLDLFDNDHLPADEEDTKNVLREGLKRRLREIPRGSDKRTVLIVTSIGLIARCHVGLKEFYDWFVGSHTLVVLVLGNLPENRSWPEEVHCDTKRLTGYFAESGMVKDVYGANA